MAKDIVSYFLEQGEPILPKNKPRYSNQLKMLDTQAAKNTLSSGTIDYLKEFQDKAYQNKEITSSDYYEMIKPESTGPRLEDGRIQFSDGSDEPDISKLKEKIIELMDNDNLTFEEAFKEAREEGYAAGGRVGFNNGSGDRTDLDYVNLTRLQNANATGSSISNASKFKALRRYDNINL